MRSFMFFVVGTVAFFTSYALLNYFGASPFAAYVTGWGVGGVVAITEGRLND